MKKFLLLMLSILMGAMMSSVDARWEITEQKGMDDIKIGDTIALEFLNFPNAGGRYLAGSKLSAAGVLTDDNAYLVEEGPLDIRTGAPTVYLKRLIDDPTRGENQNGYLKYNGGWQTITYDPDPANAANLQIISCDVDIPWSNTYSYDLRDTMKDADGNFLYRDDVDYTEKEVASWRNYNGVRVTNAKSVGFAFSTGENLYDDWTYLGSWSSADNIWFWQYTDTNQWNVYGMKYISDLQGDLQALVDLYLEEGEYVAGTDPGFYNEDVANAYNEAMQEALTVAITGTTDEEFTAAITKLKTAHAAIQGKQIPITEGYYYFVSACEHYLNTYGHEKAAYANTSTMQLYYKNFDPENVDFVFEVTNADNPDEYWVQHMATGVYVGNPSNWYASTPPLTYGKEEPQSIRYYNLGSSTGKWFWGSQHQHNTSYTPTTGETPGDTEGALTSWGQWSDAGIVNTQFNCWYLRKITDENVIAGFEAQKAQAQRTAALNDLVGEASELYGKLFAYLAPDESTKLITVANGGYDEDPTEDNQVTFSTIRKQGVSFADKYSYLIDEDDTTYMQGQGYIQVVLNEPQSVVTFEYNTRDASQHGTNPNWHNWGASERPNKVIISVTNDTVGGGTWTEVGTIEMGTLELPARATLNLGNEYKFVRYNVVNNINGGGFFTVSEFQMYKAGIDEATSQYYTTEGMKDKADAMNALLPEMRDIVAANTATQEDITKMQAALDAVKEMYADTTELAKLIAECETMLAGVEIGEEMGQLSDQALADALQAAVTDARKNAFVTPISVTAIREAEKAVKEAKAAFMAGIKSFEDGKWYFITNLDATRSGEPGTEDAFCMGNAIYLADKYNGSEVTKWGLFDEASMTLNADNNPKAMWRFIPVEGTEYYAIQNMYSGYYMGDYAGDEINLPVSEEPVPYEISYAGNGEFILYPRGGKNKNNYALWPEGAKNDVVCHVALPGTASAWTFVEIDPEVQEAISISDFGYNLIDVMAVPYNISGIADINDDVHTYAIKKMTQEKNDAGELVTTVELYEKDEFAAGEPCIIGLGNWQDESVEVEPYDLVIPFPSEVVDHSHKFVANGIVGGLHGFDCAAGTAVSNGKTFSAPTKTYGFDAQTGIIDPATYRGEVEGVETAATLVIIGLNPIPDNSVADVDGDGNVNTSDVVAIYNFIIDGTGVTEEAADVNGDGDVNSTDVVCIYNFIISGDISGQSAGSKPFYPEADGDD
ncbi:MAG: dockerin type I repeat-containing protein, partial [Bacteroidaceae bacterium]|nr:dockerin type I repeat-containing protein [Bacteroidaceae bacterium]